jgi:hypothetical protein
MWYGFMVISAIWHINKKGLILIRNLLLINMQHNYTIWLIFLFKYVSLLTHNKVCKFLFCALKLFLWSVFHSYVLEISLILSAHYFITGIYLSYIHGKDKLFSHSMLSKSLYFILLQKVLLGFWVFSFQLKMFKPNKF